MGIKESENMRLFFIILFIKNVSERLRGKKMVNTEKKRSRRHKRKNK
jgi:hypothetical protein